MSEQQKFELNLPEEHINFLLQNSGSADVQKALVSNLTLEMLKAKMSELVPMLADNHKEEFRQFLMKKFRFANKEEAA